MTGGSSPSAAEIRAIARDMSGGVDRRAAHLVSISLATLKWLMLNSGSDDVKFQAATALLGLAPMQSKLDQMRGVVSQPAPNTHPRAMEKRLRALMASPEQAQQLLSMVEQAEKDAAAASNPPNKAA